MRGLYENRNFVRNIRKYNNAFALASITVESEVGPPADGNQFAGNLKIQGQLYHKVANMNAPAGLNPAFMQLYFIDDDEAEERRRQIVGVEYDDEVLEILEDALLIYNPYIWSFKHALELIREKIGEEDEALDAHIVISNDKRLIPAGAHERTYNLPHASEVAGIIIGDKSVSKSRDGEVKLHDIVLHWRHDARRELQTISTVHRAYDPLMYVVMFPYGEDGWNRYVLKQNHDGKRVKVSEMQFYSYRIQVRGRGNFNVITRSGRLFQMYLIDQWAKVEGHRLQWAKNNQKQLRGELYNVMLDAVNANDFAPNMELGNRFILPPTFLSSPRYWKMRFQDGMAIVRNFGKPDFFVTMTCNPRWPEIQESLRPGESAVDRPDLCARVFYLKHMELREDIFKRGVLGRAEAHVESVEFQKRGLPHTHLILWVQPADKPVTREIIDSKVSAEIPDREKNPELYELVKTHNIHGPCGNWNRNLLCMKDNGGNCAKAFPKEFRSETLVQDDMYPEYRRLSPDDGGNFFNLKRGNTGDAVTVDNSWVVPYNPQLTHKFKTHLNVEVVRSVLSVKYIFKYICKGQDRMNVRVEVPRPGPAAPQPGPAAPLPGPAQPLQEGVAPQ